MTDDEVLVERLRMGIAVNLERPNDARITLEGVVETMGAAAGAIERLTLAQDHARMEAAHLREALKAARTILDEDRAQVLECVAVRGDPTSIASEDRPYIERYDLICARIDGVLGMTKEKRKPAYAVERVVHIKDYLKA